MKPWYDGLPETREFMILPPTGISVNNRMKERVKTHLSADFPDLKFSVTTAWAGEGDAYGLTLVCGQIRDDGQSKMRAPGSDAIVAKIKEALRDIDLAPA